VYACESPDKALKQDFSEVTVLRFGMNMGEGSALYDTAMKLRANVLEKSNGKLHIDIYPDQMLGNDMQMVEMTRSGTLDMVVTPTAKLAYLVPAMQFFDLPFYLPEKEDIYPLIDGELGELLFSKLQPFGLQGVAIWENGFKHFTSNRDIGKKEDFAGQRFRIMQNQVIMDQFLNLGSTPVPIDFTQTYSALRDRVVDGQENPLSAIYHMKFYEVQENLTLSSHAYLGYIFSISSKTYKKLPANYRDILISTIKELTKYERDNIALREEKIINKLEKSGMHIQTLNSDERETFKESISVLNNKYYNIIGRDVMSMAEKYMKDKYGKSETKFYNIGLNADMSGTHGASGQSILLGLQMAVEKINRQGGLLGRQVSIIPLDHKSDIKRSMDNMLTLANTEDMVAIFGGKMTPLVLQNKKIAKTHEIPYLITWAAGEEVTSDFADNRYIFRLSANDKDASRFLVNKAIEKGSRIALLAGNTIWGVSNLRKMKSMLMELGIPPVAEEVFDTNKKDFGNVVDKFTQADAEIVLYIGIADKLSSFLRTMKEQGEDFTVISHWGIIGSDFDYELQNAAEGVDLSYIQTRAVDLFDSDSFKDELNRCVLCKTTISNMLPATIHAFDLAEIFFQAVSNIHNTEGKLVATEMESIESYTGMMGVYNRPFTSTSHDALRISDYVLKRLEQ